MFIFDDKIGLFRDSPFTMLSNIFIRRLKYKYFLDNFFKKDIFAVSFNEILTYI